MYVSYCGGPFVPVTADKRPLAVKDALCCSGGGGGEGEGEGEGVKEGEGEEGEWRFRQCDGASPDNVCNEVEEPTTE